MQWEATDGLRGRRWPWLVFGVGVVLPLYVVTAVTAVRSGLFDFDTTLAAEQYKSVWSFVGAGLAVGATILGALLTKSHNDRTHELQRQTEADKRTAEKEAADRLRMDTVVSCLGLISSNGKYSTPASIAGGLTSLIRLGQPVVAIRALTAAIIDRQVDPATTAWICSKVLAPEASWGELPDTEAAKEEAAALLATYADTLTDPSRPGVFHWPDSLTGQWVRGLSNNASRNALAGLMKLVLSQPRSWWDEDDGTPAWVIYTLGEAVRLERDSEVQQVAAEHGRALLDVIDLEWINGITTGRPRSELVELFRARAEDSPDPIGPMVENIQRWNRNEGPAAPVAPARPVPNSSLAASGAIA